MNFKFNRKPLKEKFRDVPMTVAEAAVEQILGRYGFDDYFYPHIVYKNGDRVIVSFNDGIEWADFRRIEKILKNKTGYKGEVEVFADKSHKDSTNERELIATIEVNFVPVDNESLKEDANEKMVIYTQMGEYCVTPKSNYGGRMQNSRKVHHMKDFESAREVMDYWNKYFHTTDDDFIIINESLKEDISDYEIDKVYKKLSKLNKVDFGALEDEYLKTRPSLKDAVYKFYGTILNTKSYCKDFVRWAKEEKGIDLKGLPCRKKNESIKEDLLPDEVYDILTRNAKRTYVVTARGAAPYHYEINTEYGIYAKVPNDMGFLAHWFLDTKSQDTIEDMEYVAEKYIDKYDCEKVSVQEYKKIVNGRR